MNPTSFGITDPLFNQDVSFFAFTRPMYNAPAKLVLGHDDADSVGMLVIYPSRS
jgi:uncharacterized membrane protein (UPF0182 family)